MIELTQKTFNPWGCSEAQLQRNNPC